MPFPSSLPDKPASRAKDRRPYGREYPVSKVEGNFLTITAAIAAAVADGFGPGSPAVVRVYPGTYTESFSMVSGIDVVGVDGQLGQIECTESVEIVGTITYATPTAGGIATEIVTLQNVNVNPSAGSSALLFSGVNPQLMTLRNVTLCADNDVATDAVMEITNTGAGSRLGTIDCIIRQDGATADPPCVILSSAGPGGTSYFARRTSFLRFTTLADTTIIEVSGGAGGLVSLDLDDECIVFGRLEFAAKDQGGHQIRNTRISTGDSECILISRGDFGGAGTYLVENCVLNGSGTGPAITIQSGAEGISTVLYYAELIYESTRKGISTLIRQGQLMDVPANRFVRPATAGGLTPEPNDLVTIDTIAAGFGSTITLPATAPDTGSPIAAAALPGSIIEVKVVDESGSVPDGTPLNAAVTVVPAAGDTIDGSTAAYAFRVQGEFARFTVNDAGTGWLVSGNFRPGVQMEFTTGPSKTAAYTASSFEHVRVDSSGGAVPITMPASPAPDDQVGFIYTTATPVASTMAGNGNSIVDPTTNTVLATATVPAAAYRSVIWQFDAVDSVWRII